MSNIYSAPDCQRSPNRMLAFLYLYTNLNYYPSFSSPFRSGRPFHWLPTSQSLNWSQSLLIAPIVRGHTLLGRNVSLGAKHHAIRTSEEGPKPCNSLIRILSFIGHEVEGISCDLQGFRWKCGSKSLHGAV